MKLFNLAFWTVFAVLVVASARPARAEAEVKRVCHEVNGKQICKNVKVHKKVEGTPVPDAPARKKK